MSLDIQNPLDAPVTVHSIVFRGDGVVEITYTEERDVSEHSLISKSVSIDAQKVEETPEFYRECLSFLDSILEAHRNPPKQIGRGV